MSDSLQAKLARVEERIARATARSGRNRDEITLIAVTKRFPAATIREGYDVGLRDFGENYVQELAAKRPELTGLAGARFHLIGHLQSNKAGAAVEVFDSILSLDTPKLARRLNDHGRDLDVMIEVKLSGEASKSGVAPDGLPPLVEAVRAQPHLRLLGLMTMPPWSDDAEIARPYFARLRELAARFSLRRLSMGMSNDFEVAIEEGATDVRVGTAIFGLRRNP